MTGTETTSNYKVHDGKFGKILESTVIRYERIDSRREKKYRAIVGFHFMSLAMTGTNDVRWGDFEKHIKSKFVFIHPTTLNVYAQGSFCPDMGPVPEEVKGKRCVSISVEFTINYAKPRWIVDRENAENAVRGACGYTRVETIREKIIEGIEAALQEREEEEARKTRRAHADTVARNLAKRATKVAKAITNYETKLKALHEEIEAKRREILQEITTDLLGSPEQWKFTDGTPIDRRSVLAAIKNAEKAFVAEHSSEEHLEKWLQLKADDENKNAEHEDTDGCCECGSEEHSCQDCPTFTEGD
jgi:hypothetical protein